MRTFVAIAATLLMAQYGFAQPPAGGGGGRGGGRGGAGGGAGGRGQAAPAPPPDPGFECIDSPQVPEFPQAALRSHVDGTVWIHVAVTAQGAAGKIDNEVSSAWGNASMLLVPPVEKVLRAAKFKPECYGKTVAVVYRYQLHGNAVAAPKPTNRMEQPNIMFIESEPAMTAAAPKAAAPASK